MDGLLINPHEACIQRTTVGVRWRERTIFPLLWFNLISSHWKKIMLSFSGNTHTHTHTHIDVYDMTFHPTVEWKMHVHSDKPWFLSKKPFFPFRYVRSYLCTQQKNKEKYTHVYIALGSYWSYSHVQVRPPPRSFLPVENKSQHSEDSPSPRRKERCNK